MQKHYTEEDLKTVIGQVSTEISKITGLPKEEIYPFSELNQDIGMSISELVKLEISLESKYNNDFSTILEETHSFTLRKQHYTSTEKQTVETLAKAILEINPDAAQVGMQTEKILPQKKAEQRLFFKMIDKQNTRQK